MTAALALVTEAVGPGWERDLDVGDSLLRREIHNLAARYRFCAERAGAPAVDEDDVVRAVRFARDLDLNVAVRGGGHSVAGMALNDNGLVVDLRHMRAVTVDPAAEAVRVAGPAPAAPPGGDSGSPDGPRFRVTCC